MRGFIVSLLILSAACAGDHPSAADTPNTVRFIVAFQTDAVDPARPEFVRRLAQTLGGEVTWLHAGSGNTAVYRLTTPLDSAAVEARLVKLGGQPPIRYAEPDRRRDIRKQPKTGKK